MSNRSLLLSRLKFKPLISAVVLHALVSSLSTTRTLESNYLIKGKFDHGVVKNEFNEKNIKSLLYIATDEGNDES
ncbi:hypothetical protein EON65_51215 [archaeon]|nr:MAG: hypothetical protein EON65_51215 [archaeon]